MTTFYISLCSPDLEAIGQKIADQCESCFEGRFFLASDRELFAPEKVRERLSVCDVLMVAIGEEDSARPGSTPDDYLLNARIRFEIVSAMNLDLIMIPLLIGDAALPDKSAAPGAWKRLLNGKSYRLRQTSLFEDLDLLFDDLQDELDFKREVEEKLSRSNDPNFLGLADSEGKPLNPHGLGLERSGALELRRAIESARFDLDEARRLKNRQNEITALSTLGLAYTRLGQTGRAIAFFEEELKLVREGGNAKDVCALLANLGDACAVSGAFDRAKKFYDEQLILADAGDCRLYVGSALNGLGFVYVKRDNIPRALECYLKALAIYRECGDQDKELELLVGIGLNYQKLEEFEKAAEFLEQAAESARYHENRKEEAQVLVDLGETHFRLGNPERVETCLKRAQEILEFREGAWAESLRNRLLSLRNAPPAGEAPGGR